MGPKSNHRCPKVTKREAERHLTIERRSKMSIKEKIEVMSQAKEYQQLTEAGRGKKQILH